MNKYVILLGVMLSLCVVSAEACDINISLLNQDPYPAVPGDYVKLVFQINGVADSECGDITFQLKEDYPLIFDPGETGLRTFKKVDFLQDYEDNILIPYKVRVDENAIEGANPIEIYYQSRGEATVSKTFDIEIEDTRTNFEVFVDNYDSTTKELTLQILNTGDADIEALTVTLPKQEAINVKGSNKIIAGDLDSNEYTTVTFEAEPVSDSFIVNLVYSDEINERRTQNASVPFDSEYFTNMFSQPSSSSGVIVSIFVSVLLLFLILLMLYVAYVIIRSVFRRKKPKNL